MNFHLGFLVVDRAVKVENIQLNPLQEAAQNAESSFGD